MSNSLEPEASKVETTGSLKSGNAIALVAGIVVLCLTGVFFFGRCPRCGSYETVPIKTFFILGTVSPLDTEEKVHLVPETYKAGGNVYCRHCQLEFIGVPRALLGN